MVLYSLLTVVIIIVCILLGGIVLIQNPKGGGLSATFGQAGNQLLGFQKSTDIVEKWTWYMAVALLVLCLGSATVIDRTPAGSAAPAGVGPTADPNLPSTQAPVPTQAPPETGEPSLVLPEGEGGEPE